MSDLIIREINGEDIYTRTIVYDKVHAQLFNNWLATYLDMYELFDNAQVMSVKITWDFGLYWGIPSLIFTNGGFTNMDVLKTIFTPSNSFGDRFGKLNKQVQQFYLDWGRIENAPFTDAYIDPMSVPFVAELHKGLEFIHESEEKLISKLEENLSTLEKMAAEIFRVVSTRIKNTPGDLSIDPYKMSLKLDRDEIMEQGNLDTAIAPDSKIADAISALWLKEKVVL